MDYKKQIEELLALKEGNGSRCMRVFNGFNKPSTYKLCSVEAFVTSVGMPWEQIKHIHPTPEHPVLTKLENVQDINNPEKYRWVSTMVNPNNDAKYGRNMFCLKTGILRGQTMGEFYETSTVD